MRVAVPLLIAAVVLSACADGPQGATPVASATPVARASSSNSVKSAPPAVTSEGSHIDRELIKKAASVGYLPRTRQGVAVFCRTDASVGTRFATEKCIGEQELAETVARMLEARENLNKGSVCGTATCGGN